MKRIVNAVIAVVMLAGAAGAADIKWNVDVFGNMKKGTLTSATYKPSEADINALSQMLAVKLPSGCVASLKRDNLNNPIFRLAQGEKKIETGVEFIYTVNESDGATVWTSWVSSTLPDGLRWATREVRIRAFDGKISDIHAVVSTDRYIPLLYKKTVIDCYAGYLE